MSGRLAWNLRWRLAVLWALQWGITGAILTYLPLYFTESGLSAPQLGELMAVSAVGLWVAPLVVGQVCDRWLASEKYLAVSHFIGGLTLAAIPLATRIFEESQTEAHFTVLLVLVGLYAIAYFPTVPLASSMTFRHLPDPDAQFSSVRIWGTLGWVLSGLSLSLWLGRYEAEQWLVAHFPGTRATVEELEALLSWLGQPAGSDCFRIAALLSFALSSFCVFLPPTPPARSDRGAIAPLETIRMFRDPAFSLLIAVSFLLAMAAAFYTLEVPKLIGQFPAIDADWVPALMTIGQISEFPALLLLPFCLNRFGLKMTFGLGMAAWMVRYVFFAFQGPLWLVLTGIAFHGVCHVFLIIVIQLFVDSKCRRDVRASAQNLIAFITMGLGMPIGFLAGGKLGQWCTVPGTGEINYHIFFSVPAVVIFILLLIYWRWFHPSPEEAAEAEYQPKPTSLFGAQGRRVES